MSERPTPETDALISVGLENADRECVLAEFARKLERERDEARAALADWENAAVHVEADHPDEKHCGCVSVLRKLLDDARSERDEALEKIKQQKLEIVRLNGATNHAGGTPLKIALRERDEARESAEELSDIASKYLSFLLAITPTTPNDTHGKETKKVIDALNRWKKL